jgi:hypothetical protein
MPRKVVVAFVAMGSLVLLMCGALMYLGKGKWVALILGFHAVIVILWYSIRAVRPHQPDVPGGTTGYSAPGDLPSPDIAEVLERDWASEPPPPQT